MDTAAKQALHTALPNFTVHDESRACHIRRPQATADTPHLSSKGMHAVRRCTCGGASLRFVNVH